MGVPRIALAGNYLIAIFRTEARLSRILTQTIPR